MENSELSKNIKALQIIYFALILGQVFFFAVVFFLKKSEGLTFGMDAELTYIFGYIAPLITISVIPAGYFLYSRKCKEGKELADETEKMNSYRTASIIKYALFEAAGFFSILAFMLTSLSHLIYLFLVVLIIFFINMPSESKFKSDLYEEQL